MKNCLLSVLLTIASLQMLRAQDTTKNVFYSKDFNWTIIIPPSFETVDLATWAKLQNKGVEAIEKTYNKKLINESKTIFIFRSDRFNYFEANYQPFDVGKDGNYAKSVQAVNDVLFTTLKTQMPGASIDTAGTNLTISNKVFKAFIIRAVIKEGVVLNMYSFTHLFGKKEFCVNVIFLNNAKGDLMLNAWKNSTFAKM